MRLPPTPRRDVNEVFHGVRVRDPYRWLENDSDPQVARWVAMQNQYAQQYLSALPGRARIEDLLRASLYIDERSVPLRRKDRFFYWSRNKTENRPSYYYRDLPDGNPELILGPSSYESASSYLVQSFEYFKPSPDGTHVACHITVNDQDDSAIEVIAVETGEVLHPDRIEGLRGGDIAWTADSQGFFYVWVPRPSHASLNERILRTQVRYHRLGTAPETDMVVWTNPGEATSWPGVEVSEDGELLIVTFSRHSNSASRVFLGRTSAMPPPLSRLAGHPDAYYRAVSDRNVLYILTNEAAPRQRVLRATADELERDDWVEIVPQDREATIQDIHVFGGRLVLRLLRKAYSELQIRALDGTLERVVALPGMGIISELTGSVRHDGFFFKFQSYVRPPEIWEVSVTTGHSAVVAKPTVALDVDNVEIKQVFYTSKDGTRISMFLVAKKGLEKSGSMPTLLYGYGGNGISITPVFSPTVATWVDLGGLYAAPNLRGGGEYGELWHRGGTRENKQNVFDDFMAAAEWLVEQGYTRPERLAIRGGSNGGLLIGAVLTQRPDLFGAASCIAPILDMVRFHKTGAGMAWVSEYGNPDDPEDFQWLYSYSPYHAVEARTSFPGALVTTHGLDDRVPHLHARKFAAALQWAQNAARPILYKVEDSAGHLGTDMRQQRLQNSADEIAFLLSQIDGLD